MPVEVESSSKTAVNARLSAVSTRRSRNESQIDSSSDFYAELLRFNLPQNTQDVGPPAPIAESPLNSTPEAESDPTVTAETDTNAEDETSQDSEASDQAETALVSANQVTNSQNHTLDQDLIVSSGNRTDEEGNPTNDQADLGDKAIRTNEDVQATGRYNPEQSLADKSNRSARKRDLKGETTTDTSKNATAIQDTNANREATSDQPTDDTLIRSPATVDEIRGLKKERASSTEAQPAQSAREWNQPEDLREDDAAVAARKPLRPVKENTTASTEQANTRAAIVTPEMLSKKDKDSRSEGSTSANNRYLENSSNTNQEGSRIRRRNDRGQTRTRGGENPREPADRVLGNDPSSVRRADSTFSPTVREAVISQGMRHVSDSEVPITPTTLASVTATSNTVQPTLGAPIVAAMDATSSTRGVSPSTTAANRVDPQLQTGAIASANSAAPSIQTPERASSTAPSSAGSRLSQHQESKLVQRVLRGMEQLADGGGQVRLRLHPPELGSLQMSLRIEGNAIFAEMQVETTSARDALMKNLPVLKERLSEQGMQIELFDVRSDGNFDGGAAGTNSQGSQNNSESGSSRQSSRYVDQLSNRLTQPSMSEEAEIARRWTRTHGALDFQA